MKSREEYLATMEHIRKLVQEAVQQGANQIEVFEYVQTMLPKGTVSQNDLANIVRDEYFRTNPLFTKGKRPFGLSSSAPSYQCFILDEYSDTISATNADNFHQVVDFFNEHGVPYEKVKKEGENVFVFRTTRENSKRKKKKNPEHTLVKAHKKFNFKEPRKVGTQNLPINEHDQLFEVGMMPRIHYVSQKENQDVEYEHKFKHDVRIFCSVGKKYLVVMRKDRKPFDVSDWFYD